jgi:RHS repeat-associated protein
VSVTDARINTTHYQYDALNRRVKTTYPDETLDQVAYDALGRNSSKTDQAGLTTQYGYDAVGRLVQVTDALGQITRYGYDEVGNRISQMDANNHVTTYQYDKMKRRTQRTLPLGMSEAMSYDALYRLTGETIAGDPDGADGAVTYTLDPVGNRLSRSSTLSAVPSITNSYDANDRLDGNTYDLNGSPTAAGGSTYIYDFENRLKQAGGVSVVYDGDGNRVVMSTGGVTTTYLVDTANPTGLPQVLEELVGGAVQRVYTYGTSRISQSQYLNNTWTTSFYGYDGQGSVRFLTNGNGAITDHYTYDAFGNQLAASGTTPNVYRFAGEPFDQALQMMYLRARYMNPASGRFWTMDTYEGNPFDPLSLHKYLYVAGDPINREDPTGLLSNWFWGKTIHKAIGEHFEDSCFDCRSDWQLHRILGLRTSDSSFGLWRLRPDLTNIGEAEVYEIKPEGSEALGASQLTGYILLLRYYDPQHRAWKQGTSYQPPGIVVLAWGVFAVVEPPDEGVIIYDVIDLRMALITVALGGIISISILIASWGPEVLAALRLFPPILVPLPAFALGI